MCVYVIHQRSGRLNLYEYSCGAGCVLVGRDVCMYGGEGGGGVRCAVGLSKCDPHGNSWTRMLTEGRGLHGRSYFACQHTSVSPLNLSVKPPFVLHM